MGKCAVCGNEGDITAVAYVGYPDYDKDMERTVYHYKKRTDTVCRECVKKQETRVGKKGILFYLVLQLCWFNVYKNGLSDLVGFLSALIALVSLIRLLITAGRSILLKIAPKKEFPRFLSGETDMELEASELFSDQIQKEEEAYGHKIMSLREYRRKFQEKEMPEERPERISEGSSKKEFTGIQEDEVR